MLSQRIGIQVAEGTVVVGGLGLGWFMRKVWAERRLGRPNPEGNWQRQILKKVTQSPYLEAALLHCDSGYASDNQRAKAFEQAGHGTQRTYWNHLRHIKLVGEDKYNEAIKALEAAQAELDKQLREFMAKSAGNSVSVV